MKISEIITDKYKLRMPPTVYYELLADVVEVEDEQEPKTGHWKETYKNELDYFCDSCNYCTNLITDFCPNCGADMREEEE